VKIVGLALLGEGWGGFVRGVVIGGGMGGGRWTWGDG